MANYVERPTRIGGSTSEGISPGQGKVRLRLAVSRESEREGVTLTLNNVYFFPSSSSNLVSLALLNDNKIYLDNKNETLYNSDTKEILASTQRWKKSFLLKLLNLSCCSAPHSGRRGNLSRPLRPSNSQLIISAANNVAQTTRTPKSRRTPQIS